MLFSARRPGRPAFTAEDLDMASSIANHAAVAIELVQAHTQPQAAVLDDRERIATDVNDHIIQPLFAAGLSLQGVATSLGPSQARDRIHATVQDLDNTVSQIRTTIFQLHHRPPQG